MNLEEFVAHSSNVNCLKIGRRTSRVLVTGGEDHKVNLWAIGKPNAILVSKSCLLCCGDRCSSSGGPVVTVLYNFLIMRRVCLVISVQLSQ